MSRKPATGDWALYRRLLSYVGRYRLAVVGSIIGYILFALSSPASAEWLGWVTDVIGAGDYPPRDRILAPLLLLLIVIGRGIGGFMGSYAMAIIANNVMHRLRCELMQHLVALPSAYFDRNSSGRLVSKLTYDVSQVAGAVSNALVVVMREGFTVIALLLALFYQDWRLSLIFLLIAPVVGKIVDISSSYFRRYSTQMQDSMGDVTQITGEAVKGHREIHTFNAEAHVSRRLQRSSDRNRRQNMKMAMTRAASTPVVQFIVAMALALLAWFALTPGYFATSGEFVTFLGLASLLQKPVRQLTQVNAVIQRGVSAAASIFGLLDEPQERNQGSYRTPRAAGQIRFADVHFAYGSDANTKQTNTEQTRAIDGISFVAEPGQTVALVGKSGSGKSSLVGLIPRFYDYQGGSIELDGVALVEYDLHNLRQQISIVSQQVVLFNGTVAENIGYGDEQLDLARVQQAARAAHAWEFIEKLPEGLHTRLGDDAGLLSGGQRQRLAIARALLKDAPVLIFDEATSALDSESEQHIRQALGTLMQGRTTIIIAHRLSTIENADMILVLDKGRVVESGNHKQLLSKGGAYSRLHKMQFGADHELY